MNVAVGAFVYPVYGGTSDNPGTPDPTPEPSIDTYMNGSSQKRAIWAALALGDPRNSLMVDATRLLDTLPWRGAKTSPTQSLQWPRTGVTRRDGTAVDSTVYPIEVVYAAYELAFYMIGDPSIAQSGSTVGASNTKRVAAGSAEVEFFRPTPAMPLPAAAFALVSQFLAGSITSGVGLPVATGTTGVSSFDEDSDFFLTRLP